MKIGNITFPSRYPVFLAPMEDVTDIGFRLLCKQFGADMVYTEFVSSDALIRHVKKTKEKLTICEEERPVAIRSTEMIPTRWLRRPRSVKRRILMQSISILDVPPKGCGGVPVRE